jgi:hypothetical protein
VTRSRLGAHVGALSQALPAGAVCYVDRDWLAHDGPIPSLLFTPEGDVLWCGEHRGRVADDADPTALAAAALLGVAREAAAAVADGVRGPIEVVGVGLIATHVRRLVAGAVLHDGDIPGTIIDATGDPELIRAALERVSELGTVVLAGETSGRTLDVDLYSTVHKRGLVVAGIAPPLQVLDRATADVSAADLAFCRDALGDASAGARVSDDALWYRIAA